MAGEITKYDLLEERIKGMERALKLQAKEYKRRLKDLNGEASRLRAIQAEYIPREVFDRTINELNSKIQVAADYRTAQEGKGQLRQYIPWIITIILGALAYYKK